MQAGTAAADAAAAAAQEQQRIAEEIAQARAVANELLANENEQVWLVDAVSVRQHLFCCVCGLGRGVEDLLEVG